MNAKQQKSVTVPEVTWGLWKLRCTGVVCIYGFKQGWMRAGGGGGREKNRGKVFKCTNGRLLSTPQIVFPGEGSWLGVTFAPAYGSPAESTVFLKTRAGGKWEGIMAGEWNWKAEGLLADAKRTQYCFYQQWSPSPTSPTHQSRKERSILGKQ